MNFLWLWLPAWLAAVLVSASHIPLGQQVLQRGIIFLDLAIAQAAGLGIILGSLLGFEHPVLTQGIALFSAIFMAFILQQLERWERLKLEAWIGSSFVILASITLWLLAGNTHAAEHLREILAGQILWVTSEHLLLILVYYGIALVAHLLCKRAFYVVFAICITASVQLVGIYLVFATLVIPALATHKLSNPIFKFWSAFGISLIAYTLGLCASQYWDMPASPVIVCIMAILMMIFKIFLNPYFQKSELNQ